MGFLETLTELFDTEVNKRANEKLTKLAEYISREYDISLKQILRDIPKIDDLQTLSLEPGKPGQCLGQKKVDGKRCTRKGKNQGYCNLHKDQIPQKNIPQEHKEIEMQNVKQYTGSMSNENLLIEI